MSLYNIYTYWESPPGKSEPGYTKLCYESLIKHCSDSFNIYRYSDYHSPKSFESINLKTDWLKANLIYENGGFWIDADTIVMRDIEPLIKLVEKHGFAGIPGFFGAKAGNSMLKDWINGMIEVLKKDEKTEFSDLITPLLKHKKFEEFGVFTKEMICPIYHTGDEFWNLFENKEPEEFITENTYIVTLYNSAFSKEFKALPAERVRDNTDWLISKIFRKSLQ